MEPPINEVDMKHYRSLEKIGYLYNALQKQLCYRPNGIKIIDNLFQLEGDINYTSSRCYGNVADLFRAAWQESEPLIPVLLNHGADFTCKDSKGRTAVHACIHKRIQDDRLQSKKTFRDREIDGIISAHVRFNNPSNPCDTNGLSHFHVACLINNVKAVEFFLKNAVDVNQVVYADSPYFTSFTPLHFAIKYTSLEVVEILLKYGANTLLINADGLSPLNFIIRMYTEELALKELNRYSDKFKLFFKTAISDMEKIENMDDFGFSTLHIACLLQDESLVKRVLEKVEDVNQAVNFKSPVCPGFNALHFATFSNAQIFTLLLQKGLNFELKNARGKTAFDMCLQRFAVSDIYAILSTRKDWASIVLSDNKTKLLDIISAMENVEKFISFLNCTDSVLNIFVPWNATLWPGYTLLHFAVIFALKVPDPDILFSKQKDDTEIVAECLNRSADITIADAKGSTALHLAFYLEKSNVVKYLLDHHKEVVNPVDRDHLSHFHIACAVGHQMAVEHFLSNCVNINAPVLSAYHQWDFSICPGSTALHISVVASNVEISKMLLKHNVDIHAHDENGFTPVHRLIFSRSYSEFNSHSRLLLSLENLQDVTTNNGLSHLHVACYFHDFKAIEKLLDLGSDINTCFNDKHNYRPYELDSRFASFLAEYEDGTPLHFTFNGIEPYQSEAKWKIVFMLIERGANPLVKNAKCISPMDIILRELKRNDVYFPYDLLASSSLTHEFMEKEFGITKLHLAFYLIDVDLEDLVDSEADKVNAKVFTNCPVWKGRTPLHSAARFAEIQGHDSSEAVERLNEIIVLLIKHGADPLLMDDNGEIPLHMMKVHNLDLQSTVSILFENMENIDENLSNNEGLSLFHVACRSGNAIVIEKLLNKGVNVNQAISYFSHYNPGCTPLHLLMEYHPLIRVSSTWCDSSDETFLRILDKLLKIGADVNATDGVGNTPLCKIITSREIEIQTYEERVIGLRRILFQKLISNGANIHIKNVRGNTAFQLLLWQGDASWDEIEIFLKAGAHFNTFDPVNGKGYLAQLFVFRRKKEFESNRIVDNSVFLKILNDPMLTEIDSEGRTAIHNVVSIGNAEQERSQYGRSDYDEPSETYNDFYAELIEQLLYRECDIDHEDNEGKTALHSAVDFMNTRAIIGLLKNGADINVIAKDGQTAFAHCYNNKSSSDCYDDFSGDEMDNEERNTALDHFALHVYKLQFCGLHISDQNKQLQARVIESSDISDGHEYKCFHEEIEKTKGIKIGNSSVSLYEFLMNSDTDVIYINMTYEEREEVYEFIENIGKYKFTEVDCLFKLIYRLIIERKKLAEPALKSLNVLTKYELPDLCCRNILKFLKNRDLKRLIASVL